MVLRFLTWLQNVLDVQEVAKERAIKHVNPDVEWDVKLHAKPHVKVVATQHVKQLVDQHAKLGA